ncbi:Spc98 family-domain-containing protein [Paraphysoderma sedebokerense]|nr:Spc98 family-domain-containing protein [Paraphysoderma sedebokerense]
MVSADNDYPFVPKATSHISLNSEKYADNKRKLSSSITLSSSSFSNKNLHVSPTYHISFVTLFLTLCYKLLPTLQRSSYENLLANLDTTLREDRPHFISVAKYLDLLFHGSIRSKCKSNSSDYQQGLLFELLLGITFNLRQERLFDKANRLEHLWKELFTFNPTINGSHNRYLQIPHSVIDVANEQSAPISSIENLNAVMFLLLSLAKPGNHDETFSPFESAISIDFPGSNTDNDSNDSDFLIHSEQFLLYNELNKSTAARKESIKEPWKVVFPDQVFDSLADCEAKNCFDRFSSFREQDSSLYRNPGSSFFSSIHEPSSLSHQSNQSTIFGALSRPSGSNSYDLDLSLDLPPLSPAPNFYDGTTEALGQRYVQPNITDWLPIPSNEFTSSTSAPAVSFSRTVDNVLGDISGARTGGDNNDKSELRDIWRKVREHEQLKPKSFTFTKTQLFTWDSMGSYESDIDRATTQPKTIPDIISPFISEASRQVFESVYQTHFHDLFKFRKDMTSVIAESELLTILIYLLDGIDTKYFKWDDSKLKFVQVKDVRIAGVSFDAIESILQRFVDCGSNIKILEKLVCLMEQSPRSYGRTGVAFARALSEYLTFLRGIRLTIQADIAQCQGKTVLILHQKLSEVSEVLSLLVGNFIAPRIDPSKSFIDLICLPQGSNILSFLFNIISKFDNLDAPALNLAKNLGNSSFTTAISLFKYILMACLHEASLPLNQSISTWIGLSAVEFEGDSNSACGVKGSQTTGNEESRSPFTLDLLRTCETSTSEFESKAILSRGLMSNSVGSQAILKDVTDLLIVDPYDEFFIKQNGSFHDALQDGDGFWRAYFEVNTKSLVSFIPKHLVSILLQAGKSLPVLRLYHPDHPPLDASFGNLSLGLEWHFVSSDLEMSDKKMRRYAKKLIQVFTCLDKRLTQEDNTEQARIAWGKNVPKTKREEYIRDWTRQKAEEKEEIAKKKLEVLQSIQEFLKERQLIKEQRQDDENLEEAKRLKTQLESEARWVKLQEDEKKRVLANYETIMARIKKDEVRLDWSLKRLKLNEKRNKLLSEGWQEENKEIKQTRFYNEDQTLDNAFDTEMTNERTIGSVTHMADVETTENSHAMDVDQIIEKEDYVDSSMGTEGMQTNEKEENAENTVKDVKILQNEPSNSEIVHCDSRLNSSSNQILSPNADLSESSILQSSNNSSSLDPVDHWNNSNAASSSSYNNRKLAGCIPFLEHLLLSRSQHSTSHSNFMPPIHVITSECIHKPILLQSRLISRATLSLFLRQLELPRYLSPLHDFFFMNNPNFKELLTSSLFAFEEDEVEELSWNDISIVAKSILNQNSDPLIPARNRRVSPLERGRRTGLCLNKRVRWPPNGIELSAALNDIVETCVSYEMEKLDGSEAQRGQKYWQNVPDLLAFKVNTDGKPLPQHPNSLQALDFLELSYKPPTPLNLIITDSIVGGYNRIFSFILRLLRMNAIVKSTFRSIRFIYKISRPLLLNFHRHTRSASTSNSIGDSSSKPEASMQILSMCEDVDSVAGKFRVEVEHIVESLAGYVFDTAIGESWNNFMLSLENLKSSLDWSEYANISDLGDEGDPDATTRKDTPDAVNRSNERKELINNFTDCVNEMLYPSPDKTFTEWLNDRSGSQNHSSVIHDSPVITSLEDLYHYHRYTVDSIAFRCLLKKRQEPIMKLIEGCFDLIVQYGEWMNEYVKMRRGLLRILREEIDIANSVESQESRFNFGKKYTSVEKEIAKKDFINALGILRTELTEIVQKYGVTSRMLVRLLKGLEERSMGKGYVVEEVNRTGRQGNHDGKTSSRVKGGLNDLLVRLDFNGFFEKTGPLREQEGMYNTMSGS